MKKLIKDASHIISIGLGAAAVSLMFAACCGEIRPAATPVEQSVKIDIGTDLWAYKYQGHDYIRASERGLIHSQSCPCMSNSLIQLERK